MDYFQEVTDTITSAPLHAEKGQWLFVPATNIPNAVASIVRQATILHGLSLVAQAPTITPLSGGPTIESVSPIPTDAASGKHISDQAYLAQFAVTNMLPAGLPQRAISNPNVVLSNAIQGSKIINTVALEISTKPNGGIVNIPFLALNAQARSLDATIWIETLQQSDGSTFMQLQYTQTVVLSFLGVDWPHISVATLTRK